MKNLHKYLLILSVLFVIIAVAISGCTGQGQQAGKENAGVSSNQADLIYLAASDCGYPQPFTCYTRGPSSAKVRMIFDSFVERDEKGIIPWLAESWDISDDGLEYTFYLRDGVYWQDGEPFTADDVKFTFDYELKNVPVTGSIESGIVKSVEVIDSGTVKFILENPASTFLYKLTGFYIIPEHIYANVSDPTSYLEPDGVTGTGPYILDEYNKEHGTYRFVTNENFWGPDTAIKTVEFVPVSDELIAFEQGDIDFTGITPDVLGRFESDSDVRIVQQPAFWAYQFYFNMNKCPELGDKKVRQAFAYAIDRNELIEKIARGAGKPGNMGILPEDHIWYNPDQPAYSYDPEKAKELLDEAGWTDTDGDGIRDKNGEKLSYTLTTGEDTQVRIAEIIKERLGEVGIDVQVQALESRSRDANLVSGDFELLINGYGGWGQDPDFLRSRYCVYESGSGGNAVSSGAESWGYNNEELNKLGLLQLQELDEDARKDLIYQMQEILADDVPAIPLYYTTSYDAWRISDYDGWMNMYDHHARTHSKLSYLMRDGVAAQR